MIIKGEYNQAKVFIDELEEKAKDQIKTLLDEEFTENSKIRIMPDVHVGAGAVIGTTMTIEDKVVPNLVGVDIGCGLMVTRIEEKEIDFRKLDRTIKEKIPSGFNVRNTPHPNIKKTRIEDLKCKHGVDMKRARISLGSLGGGNHFIEMNEDENGDIYLVIHSGSRNIGYQVANYYQKLAYERLKKKDIEIRKDLAYLEGEDFDDYLHDMDIMQEYAYLNRKTMTEIIVKEMDFTIVEQFSSIHNYIDMDDMILRKGAVRALDGERIIIPINMKEGSLIAEGKGDKNWNKSAPHGAGRVMSRTEARKTINVDDFIEEMEDIYSTSVSSRTLDEAPDAYKPIKEILEHIDDTVDIIHHIKPIYNFKA